MFAGSKLRGERATDSDSIPGTTRTFQLVANVTPTGGAKPDVQLSICDIVPLHQQLGISPDYAASRGLSLQREAQISDLVTIAVHAGREIQLAARAAAAWTHMAAAAREEGITLLPISGFRSVARQAEIIRQKLAKGHPIAAILRINAAPGFSEHHTGHAVDIGTPAYSDLEESFDTSAAFIWLNTCAPKFGFTLSYPRNSGCGISYEPWHWCWCERPLKA